MHGTQKDVLDNVLKTLINHKLTIMYLAQNIYKVMKRGAQRRDLFLFKTNDCGYHTEEWHEINNPYLL